MSKSSTEALVEKLLKDIKDENVAYINKTLSNDKNKSNWLTVLRHEVSIIYLMDNLLDSDIILPRLVVCGVRTLAPMHYAALRSSDNILREFKTTKISPDVTLSGGSTALQFACFAGNLSTVKMLLDEWKADVNKKDGYGWSTLHYASIGGQLEVVEELCKRGLNIAERDQDGTTAAYRAHTFGHESIVEFFKKIWKGDCKELFEIKQTPSISNITTTDNPYSITSKMQRKQQLGTTDTEQLAHQNNEAKTFIAENLYDIPDDLVTRIQCKYDPSSGVYTNSQDTNTSKPTEVVYDLPYEELTLKEKSKIKIQAMVKTQLQEVFEPENVYLQEKGSAYDTINCKSENIPNIGFKTLKYLLRNEFQRYKNSGQVLNRSGSYNANSNSGEFGVAGYDVNSRKMSSMYDEKNIYEEIVRGSLKVKESKWVKGGETIRIKFDQNPPPLPPRNSILKEETFKQSGEDKKSHESFDKEFSRASTCLNLMEETQQVREACFNELLQILGPGDWQKLAMALPLRNNSYLATDKIKMIEKQYPKDYKRQARAALQDWNKHYGKDATLDNLVGAMKKCGFVEKIKNVEAANK